jgi:hypothetical protein
MIRRSTAVERYIGHSTVQWSLTTRMLLKILHWIRLNDRPVYTQESPARYTLLGPRTGLDAVENINVPASAGDRTVIPVLCAP